MGLNKKDVQNIAYGRIYGGKGLALIYRILHGIFIASLLAATIYFLILNEHSPLGGLTNQIPESIQHAPAWLYYVLIAGVAVPAGINFIIVNILNSRTKETVDVWSKTGKLPKEENKLKHGVTGK